MKTKIIENTTDTFKPFTLIIEIETFAEFNDIYSRFNAPQHKVEDCGINNTKSIDKSTEIFKQLDTIADKYIKTIQTNK